MNRACTPLPRGCTPSFVTTNAILNQGIAGYPHSQVYGTAVHTLGLHVLSTCPASHMAFARRYITINHSVDDDLHEAGYVTTLEPLLTNLDAHQSHPELRVYLPVVKTVAKTGPEGTIEG